MKELDIEISSIKNIKKAKVSIPLNRGIYGIIGNNGMVSIPGDFEPPFR